MVETTFGGASRSSIMTSDTALRRNQEFAEFGKALFESESLLDEVYRVFIGLIPDGGWNADRSGNLSVLGQIYTNGPYLLCTPRTMFSGQFDLLNDAPIENACIVLETGEFSCVSLKAIPKLPRGWASPVAGRAYEGALMIQDKGRKKGYNHSIKTFFVVMKADGSIIGAIPGGGIEALGNTLACQIASIALNAEADRNNLWVVKTSENILGATHKTPLRLGCSPEHIKSLFYARQAPISMSGRRRPILHWVQAHQRRIQAGIDIDIKKHLRGIEAFEMDGFEFSITNPQKSQYKISGEAA